MNWRKVVGLAVLMILSNSTNAQTCPHGYMPLGGQQAGWAGCAPMIQQNQTPADPGPQWATKWGAIATTNGAYGVANDLPSKRQANREAVRQCKANGGQNCKVALSFFNQCAALAWGKKAARSQDRPTSRMPNNMRCRAAKIADRVVQFFTQRAAIRNGFADDGQNKALALTRRNRPRGGFVLFAL